MTEIELDQLPGVQFILEERRRQVAKGWDQQHDYDEHPDGTLADAAYCILYDHTQGPGCIDEDDEPDGWVQELVFKLRKANAIQRLMVAGALIAAEIDREMRTHNDTSKPASIDRIPS